MVSVKQAFLSAAEFAASVLEPERLNGLKLEEVETGEVNGADVWLITLSVARPNGYLTPLSQALGLPENARDREYKTFAVRKDTGEVLSMKIREIAGA
jgi:hypothetical protein